MSIIKYNFLSLFYITVFIREIPLIITNIILMVNISACPQTGTATFAWLHTLRFVYG